jgi:D-alanine-D-alanine ligase
MLLHEKIPFTKVAILFSPATDEFSEDQQDTETQMAEVHAELSSLGINVIRIPFTLNLSDALQNLQAFKPDLVFNLVEAVNGQGRLIHLAPALLDATGISYTGADTNATFLTSNKLLAKEKFIATGIPTARIFTINGLKREQSPVQGRFIIKSVWEHASIGLGQDSIVDVTNADQLCKEMSARQPRLSGECFAEAYIDGREFNLSMLAAPGGPVVLSPAEILFNDFSPGQFKILDYDAKWKTESHAYTSTPRNFEFPQSDALLLEQLKSIALACWSAFDLHGYARVDFRVDEGGNPFVLEVNTNPCISKDAGFIAACERNQISYREVILRILTDSKH